MASSQHYGWNKDGTSKKKIKIQENTVTLSTGQSLPTGYHKAPRETAEDVSSGVQSELKELSAILSGSDLSSETNSVNPVMLRKLSYFMTDRAANEKKSNSELIKWIHQEVGTEATALYCMAHVLLGYQRYSAQHLMELETKEI